MFVDHLCVSVIQMIIAAWPKEVMSVCFTGHCHEKSQGNSHIKQKYLDKPDSEIISMEENLVAVTDDDSTDLLHSSTTESSSLTLESK